MHGCLRGWNQRRLLPHEILVAAHLVLLTGALSAPDAAPDVLTGGWSARTKLEAAGLKPFATLTWEAWDNVGGSLQQRGQQPPTP